MRSLRLLSLQAIAACDGNAGTTAGMAAAFLWPAGRRLGVYSQAEGLGIVSEAGDGGGMMVETFALLPGRVAEREDARLTRAAEQLPERISFISRGGGGRCDAGTVRLHKPHLLLAGAIRTMDIYRWRRRLQRSPISELCLLLWRRMS